ncbi:molecular chaperone DnaJ [Sphingomonadaceae bacterium G21617-S1]|jgi:molecular chaperone DnaJ|uniref:molecular chaperone DnaJ n=1 Tax=Rhizorhabdus sp. TaxID=1968843 RepID=UPI0019AA0B5E|nr:molecular chaperone DnaJ [Rhizorhabdus sp.]MBD3761813.1 molecular chaperone DnaJ [Rhizorhabdus sp.]MCZ4342687.1 molecular chaperone DnaJ [Sphingomonadaceae bacterium G21617-S1]
MSLDIDFYELLECDRTADDKVLKSSYRRLAMQYHPDRNPGDKDAEARFKAISEAYDCLKDPQKRAAYDRFGKAAFQNGGGGGGGQGFEGFSDIFENIFGEFMGGGRGGGGQRSSVRRGADLRYDLEISLEEAYAGKQATVTVDVAASCESCEGTGAKPGTGTQHCKTCGGHGKVRAQQGFFVVERTCPACHGAGQVISDPCADCRGEGRIEKTKTLDVGIPAGVDDGTRIRLSGEGEAGARGGPPGDLYIFLHLREHALFQRDGTTLFARAPISFTTAALGGTIEVPGLDKARHEIRIPAGIQSGKQIRQRGAGMPVLNGRGHGDLVIQVEVETPTKLSARQKELLEEFRATETGDESPQSSGFFARLKGVWEDLTD